jgi:hypothetical protein
MDRSSLIFCLSALVLSFAAAAAGYRYAALPEGRLAASQVPVPAEQLGEVDLGDFGTVPVTELVTYYLENPPAADSAPRAVRFQGC